MAVDGRGLDPSPTWREMVDKTMRERLTNAPLSLYREKYPELKSLDRFYGPPQGQSIEGPKFTGVPPENNSIARNICVGKWLSINWQASAQMLEVESNLTDKDPLFVRSPSDNSTARDFVLKDDSPAWKLGFERIAVEQIGPK